MHKPPYRPLHGDDGLILGVRCEYRVVRMVAALPQYESEQFERLLKMHCLLKVLCRT